MHNIIKEPLAIIGMSCIVSEANNYKEFWNMLCDESDPSDRLLNSNNNQYKIKYPTDILLFNAQKYGISEQEASIMDPQLRQFLMLIDMAFIDAGYCDNKAELGVVGVVASQASNNTYHDYLNKLIAQNKLKPPPELLLNINKGSDFLATRASYTFDLKGPSFNLQSACSSSLASVAEACYMLWSNRCDTAIAGGVSITFPLDGEYQYQHGSIYSKKGICRPFDDNADGTVPACGGGVVIIRPLQLALRDNDNIHAVIRGVGMNNDGSAKVSYAAPSVSGQFKLLQQTYVNSGITPNQLAFIECHATGTIVGDPIEVRALKQLVDSYQIDDAIKIYLGSVKGHIGHLFWSSGIMSLIKSILSLQHGAYPSTASLENLNPLLELDNTLFMIPKQMTKLELGKQNCCGVSSFGVGGTNVHVVLERHDTPLIKQLSYGKVLFNLKRYSYIPEGSLPEDNEGNIKRTDLFGVNNNESDEDSICSNIIAIYKEALEDANINDNSNYFDLYGDSISAITLIAKINERYAVVVQQDDIYNYPTPLELTKRVKQLLISQTARTNHSQIHTNYFQNRFYLLEKLQQGKFSNYNVPICLLSLYKLNFPLITDKLEIILSRMPEFSNQLTWGKDGIKYLDDKRNQILETEVLSLDDNEIPKMINDILGRRFNLEFGATARLTYIQTKDKYYLIFNFPHVVMDGTGLENLFRNLEKTLNNQQVNYKLNGLQKNIQTLTDNEIAFWYKQLKGIQPTALLCNSTNMNATIPYYPAKECRRAIPKELCQNARMVCREYKITPFILFYSILNALLANKTMSKTVLTGTTVNNRTAETAEYIGCLINNIPLRIDINDWRNSYDILKNTNDIFTQSKAYANVPLDSIMQSVKLTGTPYKILFMFQNQNKGYKLQFNNQILVECDFKYRPVYVELNIQMHSYNEEIMMSIYYNKEQYTQEYIYNLMEEYIIVGYQFINNLLGVSKE